MPEAKRNKGNWHKTFDRVFSDGLDDTWKFVFQKDPVPEYRSKESRGVVYFRCQKCDHSWRSVHGTMTFHYVVCKKSAKCLILAKSFGQMCKKCDSNVFERPIWPKEEIERVLMQVSDWIRVVVYKQKPLNDSTKLKERKRRIKSKEPHVAKLCEACHLGVCSRSTEDDSFELNFQGLSLHN